MLLGVKARSTPERLLPVAAAGNSPLPGVRLDAYRERTNQFIALDVWKVTR